MLWEPGLPSQSMLYLPSGGGASSADLGSLDVGAASTQAQQAALDFTANHGASVLAFAAHANDLASKSTSATASAIGSDLTSLGGQNAHALNVAAQAAKTLADKVHAPGGGFLSSLF
jgi:hypothetical protein